MIPSMKLGLSIWIWHFYIYLLGLPVKMSNSKDHFYVLFVMH